MVAMNRVKLALVVLASATVAGLMFGLAPVETPRVAAGESSDKVWETLITDKTLADMLKLQIDEIQKNTKTSGVFGRGFRKVERAGAAVAILGNAGAMLFKDEDGARCAALRDAGIALVKASKNAKTYKEAKASADIIASYPKIEIPENKDPKPWKDVVSLEVVMKIVSTIDTDAKNATGTTAAFNKQNKDLAHHSRMMACLAVVSGELRPEADWKGWCNDMCRDSVKLANEFGKRSQNGAKEAYNVLQKSCTDCHDKYREEK